MGLLNGLQAYWMLNEGFGTRNSMVGGKNLSQVGTITNQTGKIGKAAQFTGNTSNYLSGGDWFLQDQLSISCWIYQAQNETKYIFNRINNSFLVYSGITPTMLIRWYVTFTDNSTNELNIDSTPINTWHHWVFQWNNTTYKVDVWKNSSHLGDATWSKAMKTGVSTFRLGGDTIPFTGAIDEMGVWNRIITESEITALYNSGAGLSYPFGEVPIAQSGILIGSGTSTGNVIDINI